MVQYHHDNVLNLLHEYHLIVVLHYMDEYDLRELYHLVDISFQLFHPERTLD